MTALLKNLPIGKSIFYMKSSNLPPPFYRLLAPCLFMLSSSNTYSGLMVSCWKMDLHMKKFIAHLLVLGAVPKIHEWNVPVAQPVIICRYPILEAEKGNISC